MDIDARHIKNHIYFSSLFKTGGLWPLLYQLLLEEYLFQLRFSSADFTGLQT